MAAALWGGFGLSQTRHSNHFHQHRKLRMSCWTNPRGRQGVLRPNSEVIGHRALACWKPSRPINGMTPQILLMRSAGVRVIHQTIMRICTRTKTKITWATGTDPTFSPEAHLTKEAWSPHGKQSRYRHFFNFFIIHFMCVSRLVSSGPAWFSSQNLSFLLYVCGV